MPMSTIISGKKPAELAIVGKIVGTSVSLTEKLLMVKFGIYVVGLVM
jgi:hypothetical protein